MRLRREKHDKLIRKGKQFIHLEYVQAPEHVDRLARFSKFLLAAGTDTDEAGNLMTDCTLAAWRKAEFPDTKILGTPAKRHNVPDWTCN